MEREALLAHHASMQADVDDMNASLAERNMELDGLLSSTLDKDDYVDLESLRVSAVHPPFAHGHLRVPAHRPAPLPAPQRPVRGIAAEPVGLFGRKRQREEAEAAVDTEYRAALTEWEREMDALPARQAAQDAEYEAREARRQRELASAWAEFQLECKKREEKVAERNRTLDELIVGLGYGMPEAINEYIGIVLANSVYPEDFEVESEATYEPQGAELSLRVVIPAPDSLPTIKSYRYVKASDEIVNTELSQKSQKDRYTEIVNSVALRTLHEVFEADRRGLIKAISLEVGTSANSPATGKLEYIPFLGVAVDREVFAEIDLSGVVPSATLQMLNAAVSKNAHGLVPANVSGVRRA